MLVLFDDVASGVAERTACIEVTFGAVTHNKWIVGSTYHKKILSHRTCADFEYKYKYKYSTVQYFKCSSVPVLATIRGSKLVIGDGLLNNTLQLGMLKRPYSRGFLN
ncbi:uncharacterized protein YALI1_F00400g [Yarrowia lipolytica]|uniref:Uncharacterized protein n=1 Tax=Yarrowia lipolytica TaxID=4952 RepID=A0A1D8NLC0_YARLL|nr:hypothetical protein YALI1_F00400g [Yarrowia lipolytica]